MMSSSSKRAIDATKTDGLNQEVEDIASSKVKGKNQRIKKMFDDLGITEIIMKRRKQQEKSSVADNGSRAEGQQQPEAAVPVVKFESKKRKTIANTCMSSSDNKKSKVEDQDDDDLRYKFDMRKARHEVFRFGLTGMDKETKYEAKIAHAISLGAKVSLSY